VSDEALSNLAAREPPLPALAEFVEQANVTADAYDEAASDRLAFWDKQAERLQWATHWTKTLEWDRPYAAWFLGGTLNAAVNCVDRARGSRPRRPGRDPVRGRARRLALVDLCRVAGRGVARGERPYGAGRGQGRPGGDLPADDPRGGCRDAGVCPDRCAAQRGVRRVLGAGAL